MNIQKITAKTFEDLNLNVIMIVDDSHTYTPMTLLIVDKDITLYRITKELEDAKHKLDDWQFSELLEELTFPYEEISFDEVIIT